MTLLHYNRLHVYIVYTSKWNILYIQVHVHVSDIHVRIGLIYILHV